MTRSRCPNTPAPDVGDDAAGNHAAGHVTGYFMKRMLPAAVAALSLATLSLAPLPFAEAPAVAQAAPSDAAMRATVDRLIARMTIDGDTLPLGPRFTVIATQNPIEQQGDYPLDRKSTRLNSSH